jgi:hypothetical protein
MEFTWKLVAAGIHDRVIQPLQGWDKISIPFGDGLNSREADGWSENDFGMQPLQGWDRIGLVSSEGQALG